jgi:large subunit ribosomal protein L21
MYAIIEAAGRQFKVSTGDTIKLDREVNPDEKNIKFDRVLMIGGEGTPKIGSPILSGASVSADVLGEAKGPKIVTQKYKRRKGYHKKIGHRQHQVEVKITAING